MDKGGTLALDKGITSMQNALRTAQPSRQPAEKVLKVKGSPVGECHCLYAKLHYWQYFRLRASALDS